MFGSVLDHLLEATRAQVLVARLTRAVRRVVLAVPPGLDRDPAFPEILRTANTVAAGVGAPVHLLALAGTGEPLRAAQAAARPHVPATFEETAGWDELEARLRTVSRDDMVVLLAARRGTLAWSHPLERLPARLAGAGPGNLVVAYLPVVQPAEERTAELAPGVVPDHVAGGAGFPRCRRTDAGGSLRAAGAQRDRAGGNPRRGPVLVRGGSGGGASHVRREGLDQVLVLGVSRTGVALPRARTPIRLLFLLVSPAGQPDEHLRTLAALARFLSDPARVEEVVERFAPDLPLDLAARATTRTPAEKRRVFVDFVAAVRRQAGARG